MAALPAPAMQVHANMVQDAACGAPTGAIDVYTTGGVQPYTYLWSNGATSPYLTDLAPGTYSVTVTDSNGDEATGSWTIHDTSLSGSWSAQDGHASCTGQIGGEVQVIEWGINGTPPYSYSPPPDGYDQQGDPYFIFQQAAPGQEVTIEVTDANGCTGTLTQTVVGPQMSGPWQMEIAALQGSCSGSTNGTVTITNINDGSFFTAPEYLLRDASGNYVDGGSFAPNTLLISNLAPGDYYFTRDWDPSGMYMAYPCTGNPYDRIDFTIPDLGMGCNTVSGTVFIDNDQDCVQDAAEVGVPYCVLEILPGPTPAITNAQGHYDIALVNGNYTLGQTGSDLVQLCPATAPVPFAISTGPVMIDLADSSTVPLDLSIELSPGTMRPGSAGAYWGRVRNLSVQVSGPVTVTLGLDAALLFVGATPMPTLVAGNTITWELPAFTAYQIRDFAIDVQVPAGTSLGTLLSTSFGVVNTLPEATTANNTLVKNSIVVGSYDPNDKTARTSTGISDSQYFIAEDEWIEYTIRFQNTGTDTAFTVVITDTLSAALDMATFQQGVASHPFSVAFRPDRTVEWRFDDILLPDSNVNEPRSHGLVSFRIHPHLPVAPGSTIENSANIYFDLNEPVITEPSVLVAEFSTAMREQDTAPFELMPNPTDGLLHVRMLGSAAVPLQVIATDGRVIDVPVSRSADRVQLDVRSLPAGVYVIRTAEGSARFVKR